MLIHGEHYLESLKLALANTRSASLAVAFWGGGAELLFSGWKGESLRIICNLASGGTNPDAIEELGKLSNVEVRQLSDLHAKLVLTDSRLIVGSANVSVNGLGLEEEEQAGWREAGIITDDAGERQSASAWFEQQWNEAQPITEADLEAARVAWKRRRRARPPEKAGGSLMQQLPSVLKDRPIYLAVYRQYASERAGQALTELKEEIARQEPENGLPNRLEVFEGWDGWDGWDILNDSESILIQVYWGLRGKIAIHDVIRPVPELQSSYWDEAKSEDVRLDFLVKQIGVESWTFSREDQLKLKSQIRPWLELYGPELEGWCYPFYEFRQWQLDNPDVALQPSASQ